LYIMTVKLKEGNTAPDFELLDQDGRTVSSKDLKGKKVVVLYFYPADFTKVCTMEAVAFRNMHEQFQAAGAEIVGVSSDDVSTHKEFAKDHELTFLLLSDPKQELRAAFGAFGIGGTPARTTYVIDQDWRIRMVYSSPLRSKEHAEEAMKAIKAL
jgi:thioredoxin-dependent peroxiredoxin